MSKLTLDEHMIITSKAYHVAVIYLHKRCYIIYNIKLKLLALNIILSTRYHDRYIDSQYETITKQLVPPTFIITRPRYVYHQKRQFDLVAQSVQHPTDISGVLGRVTSNALSHCIQKRRRQPLPGNT